MEVLDRLDTQLTTALSRKGWKRQGTRRFVGETHVVEMLPAGVDDRVTVFYGRCITPGDPSRLAECTRITLTDAAGMTTFVARL